MVTATDSTVIVEATPRLMAESLLGHEWLIWARNCLVLRCLMLALVSAFTLASCGTVPKKEHELLSPVRQMGSDLPVRRAELIARCHLKGVPSTRLLMGLRGGWGGIFESWSLPDGGKLIARFNTYSGGFKVVRSDPSDGHYSFSAEIPEVPATTWFNEVVLVDDKDHILFSNEKRPPVQNRGGKKLPDSRSLL